MAWDKQGDNGWSTWNANVRSECQLNNPTGDQNRPLSSVSYHSSRYREVNGVIYGHLVFTLNPPYFGGTHSHLTFDLPVSKPVIGIRTLGSGIWHTVSTSPGRSGGIAVTGDFWGTKGYIWPIKANRDTWAESNIKFYDDAGYQLGCGIYNNGTRFTSNHDGIRRLANSVNDTSIAAAESTKFNILLHYP